MLHKTWLNKQLSLWCTTDTSDLKPLTMINETIKILQLTTIIALNQPKIIHNGYPRAFQSNFAGQKVHFLLLFILDLHKVLINKSILV